MTKLIKPKLAIAIIISLLVHTAIIGGLVWLNCLAPERPAGKEEYIVSIDLVSNVADRAPDVLSTNTPSTEPEAGEQRATSNEQRASNNEQRDTRYEQ